MILLLKISLVIFIAGNLFEMGLLMNPRAAISGLRNYRFVCYTLLWSFVVGPTVAFGLSILIPLDPAYAMGLVLMGLSPCAPFLPMLVKKAQGDLGYTAAFMLIASLGTVFFMPIAVPLLVQGLTVSSWAIAKPLLITLLIPLTVGMAILRHSQVVAQKILPAVKKVILGFTLSTLALSVLVYGKGLFQIDALNVFAALILFFASLTLLSYWLGVGLRSNQKIVLSMGVTTRNLGASVAPLLSLPLVDEKTIVIIVMGAPVMIGSVLLHAKFIHRTEPGTQFN